VSIRFENVKKSFGPKLILDQISFDVLPGEILFILGRSGVGKSVTLKQIVGLIKPDSGKIFVDGQEITTLTPDKLTLTRKKCGMVFQHPALLDSLTIYENVAFALKDYAEDKARKKVIEKLALVHLTPEILGDRPPEISYGMQKRVSLARALAPEPSYLLFDEPTTGLDPITTNAVTDLIRDLSKKLNVTSIVVSHDMGSALRIADRILVLDRAQILEHGTVEQIKNSPHSLVQEFLEEALAVV